MHILGYGLVCSLIILPWTDSLITEAPLPPYLRKCYEQFSRKSLSKVVGKSLCWYCEAPLRGQIKGSPKPLATQQRRYLDSLGEQVNHHIRKRQANRGGGGGTRCLRKEYRMLTEQERYDYHRAIQLLKNDTSVLPNQYDAFAMAHVGDAAVRAHGGPGFYGWHRVYLMMYEQALQSKVPGVCLPYIANTIEAALGHADSFLWSDEMLGTPNGAVTSGPFAGWTTPVGTLTRNVGNQAFPMDEEIYNDILSRNTMAEISSPTADLEYDLEFHHGSYHIFVGGTMESIDTASFEPAFFMHHAYIDYVWEMFRNKMVASGGDPYFYPEPLLEELPLHRGNESLRLMGDVTHRMAYGDITNYDYQPVPSCSRQRPHCDTNFLQCNYTSWQCYPKHPRASIIDPPTSLNPSGPINLNEPFNPLGPINPRVNPPGAINPQGPHNTQGTFNPPRRINPQGPFNPSETTNPQGPLSPHVPIHPEICQPQKHAKFVEAPKACQNTFCINGVCDINQWIYIPVKVISNRPPEFKGSQSFPVRNGKEDTSSDIYAPNGYTVFNNYIKPRAIEPKGYGNCEDTHGIGQIFISSQGINYDGYYTESSIIDQRLATSISIAYLAVKNIGPQGKTSALLRAFDQCGRICHTSCRIRGSNPARYRPCSGVIDITPDTPKQYSRSYGESLLDVWGYRQGRECPVFGGDDFFMSFYCDYKDRLPWVEPTPLTPTSLKSNSVLPPQFVAPPKALPINPPKPVLRPENLASPSGVCKISSQCTLNMPCASRKCDRFAKKYPCMEDCSRYALCVYGKLYGRSCIRGMYFNKDRNGCSVGSCLTKQQSSFSSMFG